MEILNEKSIALPEMGEYIQQMKKRDKELNFRAKKVEEYLKIVPTVKNYKELIEELQKVDILRLKDKHISLIVNIFPKDLDSLRSILAGENITLKEEDLKKILEIVIKYA